jgi:EAL domain-containing protein (putative c-di-GMP-specific phosphodiesterase class I)
MLIRQAHQAMIEAKQSGKGRYKIFNPDRDRAIKMRLGALEDIVSGLVREEFHVEYQPKVNLKTGKLIGLEALARWQHPTRGLLQPLEFLPALTESSAKTAFTEHLIKMVFAQSVLWAKEGFRPLVSLNVYINQLHDSFYQFIGQELARVPEVKPCNIEFELLETDELLNINDTVTVIESLREMGFTFSVDDFGSGYSSLTYLRKIPFDTIKIDQDFVLNDGLSEKNADIVRAIIELARIFKRQVIAEGIETIEAGTTLIEMGCPNGQGFAIAKPMPASEVFDWCRTWKAPQAWLNASPG